MHTQVRTYLSRRFRTLSRKSVSARCGAEEAVYVDVLNGGAQVSSLPSCVALQRQMFLLLHKSGRTDFRPFNHHRRPLTSLALIQHCHVNIVNVYRSCRRHLVCHQRRCQCCVAIDSLICPPALLMHILIHHSRCHTRLPAQERRCCSCAAALRRECQLTCTCAMHISRLRSLPDSMHGADTAPH